jgi:hypothetical protein
MTIVTTKRRPKLKAVTAPRTAVKERPAPRAPHATLRIETTTFNFVEFREAKRVRDDTEAAELQARLDREAARLAKAKAKAEEAILQRLRDRTVITNPWETDTPEWRAQHMTAGDWRIIIDRALVLHDAAPPSQLFRNREYANSLTTILLDRRKWRLFDKDFEAEAYIAKEGEWAWSVLIAAETAEESRTATKN